MKARTTRILLSIVLLSMMSYPLYATDIFSDSFESADLKTTNQAGFRWTDSAWVTLVTQTHEVWWNNKSDFTLKASAHGFPGGDWSPKTGQHSMRFRYAAGEAMSEQRFDLGTPMKDVWIRFWVRVPTNFSFGPTGNPNKFFALWTDKYSSGDGSTVWLCMQSSNNSGAGLWFSSTPGNGKGSSAAKQTKPFITTADRGRWMHIVFHVKTESSSGAGDGVIQTYRRWDGDSAYTKLHEAFNLPIKVPSSGPNGFKAGYLLGWANAAYKENTEWLIDDFTLSDSPPNNIVVSKQPDPPTNLIVQQ